jgi:hypothetical protein
MMAEWSLSALRDNPGRGCQISMSIGYDAETQSLEVDSSPADLAILDCSENRFGPFRQVSRREIHSLV